MSELRWILVAIAIVIIVGTLVYAQFSQKRQERNLFDSDREEPNVHDSNFGSYDAEVDVLTSDYPMSSADSYVQDSYSDSEGSMVTRVDYADSLDSAQGYEPKEEAVEEEPEEQYIVALHVISRQESFEGRELKNMLEHIGLRFGKFGIYHRESLQDPDMSLFSVANMYKPGKFDIDNLATFNTKGLSFFLVLPGPPDAVTTFNEMLQTAKQIATKLDADVYDADRSTFSGQRAQLIRDEIVGFMHKISQD